MDYLTAWRSEILVAQSERAEGSLHAERTDRQLVDLTLAGDESAFEIIFERHKRHVAMVAGRYFQSPHEIEEIVQCSFIKAYFELGGFRGLHDFSLVSWLGRITANTCLNVFRTRTRKFEDHFADISEVESLAADLIDKSAEELASQRDLLEKLLASLSVEDRVLLQMLYSEEMSVAEVSEVFEWSRAKVRVRAFRAKHSLKRILKRFL
jgi:RNA polymerase sigma-70 factor (ECF subfamily)